MSIKSNKPKYLNSDRFVLERFLRNVTYKRAKLQTELLSKSRSYTGRSTFLLSQWQPLGGSFKLLHFVNRRFILLKKKWQSGEGLCKVMIQQTN